jgi:ABC-2 type transport system ATP-binding protein
MSWGVRDVEVRFRQTVALRGVTVEVRPSMILVVLGGDGAGKTTLLRILAGALEPHAGEVRRPEPRRIGYFPAGPGAYPDLTVRENMAFAASAYGVAREPERVEDLLRRTGLTGAGGRLARHLSGGMRRKLAVAMAMVHRPALLVLDEPTTGVDPVSRVELWRMFAGAAADGAAVVIATTYVDEGERAGHVLVLDRGRQLLAGPPARVMAEIPGAVLEAGDRPPGLETWRRGPRWRAWSPDGRVPRGASRVRADLEDAVVVASLETEADALSAGGSR